MDMVSALEDPTYTATKAGGPLPRLSPVTVTLKNNEIATAYPVAPGDKVPMGLLEYMSKEFNDEVERGQTYPHEEIMTSQEFRQYWFGSFVAILVRGDALAKDQNTLMDFEESTDWSREFLGTFYIKPNYPGRCSDVCNAGFVVNTKSRGLGIGTTLGKIYLQWAPQLGYTYSVFNLVFVTNPASYRIWDALGFDRIGLVKKAARLKGFDKKVDAIIYGKSLVNDEDDE